MGFYIILSINSILLVLATFMLSKAISHNINIKKIMKEGMEKLNDEYRERRLQREVKKYIRNVSIKMTFSEKVELYLIDKSNIRRFIPFMNFNVFVILCLGIFLACFGPIYRVMYFIPSTFLICLMFAMIPVFILDIMGRYNSERVRRKLAEFISVLNRWCAVKEDIFYAFERSIESGLGEPLKTFIRDMTIQVKCGIEPADALDILQMKVDNEQFRDFIINIKQNVKFRGNITKLLSNMESQFYKLEEEYNRRKICTYKDRLLIFVLMFSVLVIGYFFLKFNQRVQDYYLGTLGGKTLLAFFCLIFLFGFYLSLGVSKFKH